MKCSYRNLVIGVILAGWIPNPSASQQTSEQEETTGEASRSTAIEVKPSEHPTIKTTEIDENRAWNPVKRMPRQILYDQKAIWTSPFHTAKSDIKWWLIFGGATAALIATDKTTYKELPNSSSQISVATWTSRIGAAYTLIPVTGAFYVLGTKQHDERLRETAILGAEALIGAEIFSTVVKVATDRARPTDTHPGDFWASTGSLNGGFPSGHAISTWALASVIAHEYPRPLVVPIASYGFATVVVASRFAAQKHFASDVIVGSAIGWFIGDFVFAKRHNRSLDRKPSAIQKIVQHIDLGGAY